MSDTTLKIKHISDEEIIYNDPDGDLCIVIPFEDGKLLLKLWGDEAKKFYEKRLVKLLQGVE